MRWALLAAVVIGCSPSTPPVRGCESSADCTGGRACIDGRCTAPPVDAGGAPDDASACACEPGEVCGAAGCAPDCGDPASVPCTGSDVCDHATGRCVAAGTSGILTGEGESCGASGTLCLPGTECSLAGTCVAAPPCLAIRCSEGGAACWGSACASTRPVAACAPAPLERMRMPDFLLGGDNGITDLELDDACNAYGVTVISGTDYLRQLAPDGTLTIVDGVTNLNMGEVAVLRPYSDEFASEPGEVALTYTCCTTCGCRAPDPQGVARLDRTTSMLPMVVVAMPSTGTGPFGQPVLDSGPYGLTWGRDRTLYVGNVDVPGGLVRADLETGASTEIARLETRVYAATTFDRTSLLVARLGGVIEQVGTDGSARRTFATLATDVTGMVRDPFLARVYASLADGRVVALDLDGAELEELAPAGRAGRIAYSPDGALYYLRTGFGVGVTVDRIELPTTR